MHFLFVLLLINLSLCMDKNTILGEFSIQKDTESPVLATFVKDGDSDYYSKSTDSSYFLKINSAFTKVFFDNSAPTDRYFAFKCGEPVSESPLQFTCTYDLNPDNPRYDDSLVNTKYYLKSTAEDSSAFKASSAFISSFVLFLMIVCFML